MKSFWQKLNHLIPAPDCSTVDGVITEWRDARRQPTDIEIDIVTDQEVIDSELDKEADGQIENSKFNKLLFEIHFDAENRLRDLEGKTLITKAQYKTAIKNIYKGL